MYIRPVSLVAPGRWASAIGVMRTGPCVCQNIPDCTTLRLSTLYSRNGYDLTIGRRNRTLPEKADRGVRPCNQATWVDCKGALQQVSPPRVDAPTSDYYWRCDPQRSAMCSSCAVSGPQALTPPPALPLTIWLMTKSGTSSHPLI
jgi:hypothetical protein